MLVALTRAVSPAMGRCELSYLPRTGISIDLARWQHRAYERVLEELGCTVLALPPEPDLPDSVFVEDTALVLEEVAVILRPGAESRQPETPSVASALAPYRDLAVIGAPGSIDGGDVLRVGRTLFVGCSGRSNDVGMRQLAAAVEPHGYAVRPVPMAGCLHLKSAVTPVAPDTLLVNRSWVDPEQFGDLRAVDVHPDEPTGANALLVNGTVVYPSSHPRTLERLAGWGILVRPVDVSELEKAEGAVTCCCVLFQAPGLVA